MSDKTHIIGIDTGGNRTQPSFTMALHSRAWTGDMQATAASRQVASKGRTGLIRL